MNKMDSRNYKIHTYFCISVWTGKSNYDSVRKFMLKLI